jgi:predicted nucleotidyltransferase
VARSKPSPALGPQGEYLQGLCEPLRALLGDDLVGVYAGGSYALGDFDPDRSDLDVAVVAEGAVPLDTRETLAARIRDRAPPPARGLELVVYRLQTTRSTSADPDFELNLNTGPGVEERVDYDTASVPGHWFPIDRSMLAQRAVTLLGPRAAEVFAPVERSALLAALIDSVRWHRDQSERLGDAVLNACRSLLFAYEGRWASKPVASEWAIEHGAAPARLVQDAFAARRGEPEPGPDAVAAYLDQAEARLIELRR